MNASSLAFGVVIVAMFVFVAVVLIGFAPMIGHAIQTIQATPR